jgi:acyl-CoA dehydrogenase
MLWALLGAVLLIGFGAPLWLLAAYAVVMAVFLITPIRRALVSSIVLKVLGPIAENDLGDRTHRDRIGSVWAEAELFSGKPDFKKLMAEPSVVTAEEQAFVDGR